MANTEQKRKREQKPRTTATGDWLYCNFSAHPEEIDKWKKLADAADRSLSWWIRNVLNSYVARLKGISNHEKPSDDAAPFVEIQGKPVGVAEVSGDRARSGD